MVIGQVDKHVELRAKILEESMATSNEPRWGYFGVGGSLAISDDSYCPIIKRKPKEEEEAAEPLRQIQAHATKIGNTPDSFFKFETSVNIGDPYQDPHFMIKKGKVKMLDEDAAFKPPGKVKTSINKLGYEYVEHKDTAKDPIAIREQYRDYMPPRPILGSYPKKGGGGVLTPGVLFGMDEERRFPEHMPDDYDAAKKLRAQELKEHKSKIQETPFKGCDHGFRNFQTNEEAFKCDQPSHVPREPKPFHAKIYEHENPFKPANPSKKGVPQSLMGGIPEYIGDPETKTQRKPKVDDEKAPFKGNVPRGATNPMPSVVCNTRNMRRERPASFARPAL